MPNESLSLKYKLEDIITLIIDLDWSGFYSFLSLFFDKYQDKYSYYRSLEIDNEYNNRYLTFIQNKRWCISRRFWDRCKLL